MVYTASLNVPVKKALGKNAMQSNISKICGQMALDPDTTNMDVVIFGPKDVIGPKAAQVQKALDTKHPDICVIYLFEKQGEADLLDNCYKQQVKKINNKTISEAFEQFVGEHKIRAGKQQTTSADFMTPDELADATGSKAPEFDEVQTGGNRVPMPAAQYEFEPVQVNTYSVEEAQQEEVATPEPEPLNAPEVEAPVLESTPLSTESFATPVASAEPVQTIEDSLSRIRNFEDWEVFKQKLSASAVTKHLILENSEYEGLVNMLDVLDKQIETVWRDSALTPEQKFDKIKEIGLTKSTHRARANSINVDKVMSIISTIVIAAKRTVDEKVNSIDVALYKISTDKQALMDTAYVDNAINERAKIVLELLSLGRSIVDIYNSIDDLVTDSIADLDKKLPSSSEFINEMVAPLGAHIFTPQNTAELANRLERALQENRVVWSQMESSVNAVIERLFELLEKDEEIIKYQQNMINLLKANHVEDVIITDTLLKKVLRVYVGADNTGRSATAITWCGILSRRQNCLLLDLTGKAKFREYGIDSVTLDDFMSNRIEKQFCCVESTHIPDPEELQNIITELKSRLNYYPLVNVIMAPEDIEGIKQICDDAICVHYITNCTSTSIQQLAEIVKRNNVQNVAHKLVTIDAPVSPLSISYSIGIDPTTTRIVTLPAIPAIKACAIKHDRPYEYNDIVALFEEAFR